MENIESAQIALAEWEASFRAAAQADGYRVFQTHLESLDLPNDPSLLLDGTIRIVQMCVAYLAIDEQQFVQFLKQQQYAPCNVPDSLYMVTFDIHGKAYARINLPASLRPLDLADLYGTPWNDYRVVGFCDIWITRTDGVALSTAEMAELEEVVTNDLRFDYSEEELDLFIDPDIDEGILKISLQDVLEDVY